MVRSVGLCALRQSIGAAAWVALALKMRTNIGAASANRRAATVKYSMFRVACILFTSALAWTTSVPAQSDSHGTSGSVSAAPAAWEAGIQQRRAELVEKNGPGTDAGLRDQLLRMRDEDKAARGFAPGKQTPGMTQKMVEQLPATDARLTAELKQVVAQKGWPTIALVGIDASNGAMLVLTHTQDRAWRSQLLPTLQQLADARKIDASPLATTVDKELVAEGKLQRYGSQFMFIGGKISMYAVEDPAHLDDRRAEALLPPISVYKQQMAQIYHLEVSPDVVMATPPAKK